MRWTTKAIDALAKVEFLVSAVALVLMPSRYYPLGRALPGRVGYYLGAAAFLLLVALALLVVLSGALFAWENWSLRRDMLAKGGGRLEMRKGQVRTERKMGPNEACHCGSGRKLKRCHREQPAAGVQLGNGMRMVRSELRDPTGKRVAFPS